MANPTEAAAHVREILALSHLTYQEGLHRAAEIARSRSAAEDLPRCCVEALEKLATVIEVVAKQPAPKR